MLVLSRKINEKVMIGDGIVVTIVKIDRNQVRIGIEAPGNVPIYREEILPLHHEKPEVDAHAVTVGV
jgi:carbon storage regulator